MKKIGKKILWVITHIEEIVSASALAMMLIAIFANVVLRYFFRRPTSWADELAIIGMAYVTFVGGAAAYKRNMHFGIDILVDRLPAKGKHILRALMTLAFIFGLGAKEIFVLLAAIGLYEQLSRMYRTSIQKKMERK